MLTSDMSLTITATRRPSSALVGQNLYAEPPTVEVMADADETALISWTDAGKNSPLMLPSDTLSLIAPKRLPVPVDPAFPATCQNVYLAVSTAERRWPA